LTAARRRTAVVLKARARRARVKAAAATQRRARIIKSGSRRRSTIFEAAAASITEAATAAGPVVVTAEAAARVAEASAASRRPVVTTKAAARRIVGPRAAAAPVRRAVLGGAPFGRGRVGRLGLGRAFGAQALRFSTMARNLFFSPLFIGGALGLFRGAAFFLLPFPLAFLLGAQRVGGRFIGPLLVLGPAPLDFVFIIFAPSSRPGDLARDGVLLVLGLGVGAVLRENRVVTFLRERTRIDSLDDTLAASCVFSD